MFVLVDAIELGPRSLVRGRSPNRPDLLLAAARDQAELHGYASSVLAVLKLLIITPLRLI